MTTISKPTIDDIARAAGVSKGTVSRVINGHATVAVRTRDHVQGIMTHMGYEPDPAARHLSWRTGRTLGIWVAPGDHLLTPYQVLLHRALDRETASLGLRLQDLTGDLTPNPGPGARWPSAVLLTGLREADPRLALLRAQDVPTVVIGHHPELSWVAPDDVGGAKLATQQLTLAGHRRLAYVGYNDGQVARDRLLGCQQAASEAGAHLTVLPTDLELLGGYRAVRQAWERGERFTGVFANGDEKAVGAIAALQDLGLRVPADVSVVGFDGLPELPLPVRLTSVAQDISRIAHEALLLVQAALAGEAPRGLHVPVQLQAGETVSPPNTEAGPGGPP